MRQTDAEKACRLPAIAARRLERLLNRLPLDRFDLGLEIERRHGGAVSVGRAAVAISVADQKILGIERGTAAEHRRPLHGIPELTDVSRPGMMGQRREGRGREAHGVAELGRRLTGEVRHQCRNVLGTLAQRREVQAARH